MSNISGVGPWSQVLEGSKGGIYRIVVAEGNGLHGRSNPFLKYAALRCPYDYQLPTKREL